MDVDDTTGLGTGLVVEGSDLGMNGVLLARNQFSDEGVGGARSREVDEGGGASLLSPPPRPPRPRPFGRPRLRSLDRPLPPDGAESPDIVSALATDASRETQVLLVFDKKSCRNLERALHAKGAADGKISWVF